MSGVLLIDWENLASAIMGRGFLVERRAVDDLWEFAFQECGQQMQHARMAAARVDPSIEAAMDDHMIKIDRVRNTKEQADIALTVLAMDRLHDGDRTFVLVTGDQDFIPLISRLHQELCKVVVVYGGRLSNELRRILDKTPGVESCPIDDITKLRRPPPSQSGPAALLALLELQRRGKILGGPDTGDRSAVLAQWGIVPNLDESQFRSLVNTHCEVVQRTQAAVRAHGQWVPRRARRTYLKLSPKALETIMAADSALRQIAARSQVRIEALRAGPFALDDGTLLRSTLEALLKIQVIRQEADGSYSATEDFCAEGYVEYLWRVYAGIKASCYDRNENDLGFNSLEGMLNARGVGQWPNQRLASRIKYAIAYARAFGVIDVTVRDGVRRYETNDSNPICRRFENIYREFYELFADCRGEKVDEQWVLDEMQTHDEDRTHPTFGWDGRDRSRVLRILSQSFLIQKRDSHVIVFDTKWGDSISGRIPN